MARQLDVYGNARFWAANPGETGGKLKFVGGLGHPSESETGLVYMRARFMDPATGRFVSEDPAGDGNNWFTYCENSPTRLSDINGKEPTSEQWLGLYLFMIGQEAVRYGALLFQTFAPGFIGTLYKTLQARAVAGNSALLSMAVVAMGGLMQIAQSAPLIAGVMAISGGITMMYIGMLMASGGEDLLSTLIELKKPSGPGADAPPDPNSM